MEEWKIKRDRKACDRPGCPLATATHHFAVLEFPECVRRDLCDACFQDYERRCSVPPVFWRALRKSAGSKEPVLDLASLRVLFDRLGLLDDDRARSLRYFCALLLLRKRLLKVVAAVTPVQQRADLVVVDPRQKDMAPVALHAPAIELSDLSAIKAELLAALGEGQSQELAGEP